MGSVSIYNDEDNKSYKVNFDLKSGFLSPEETDYPGVVDYWIEVSTTMKTSGGVSFPKFVVRNLTDVPPGVTPPATDFEDIVSMYIEYFMTGATIGQSSSSSSTSSSSSSSSTSSEGNSSSSSSEGHSLSSDSTESVGNSSSSTSS